MPTLPQNRKANIARFDQCTLGTCDNCLFITQATCVEIAEQKQEKLTIFFHEKSGERVHHVPVAGKTLRHHLEIFHEPEGNFPKPFGEVSGGIALKVRKPTKEAQVPWIVDTLRAKIHDYDAKIDALEKMIESMLRSEAVAKG